MVWNRIALIVLPAAVLALADSPSAQSQIVSNSSFELTSGGANFQFSNNTVVTDWGSTGYNFIFSPGAADTTGALGESGNLKLWGPANGSANGMPAASPDGGNYIAADGAYEQAPITQLLTGLTKDQTYVVGFWWAGAQQFGAQYNTATTEAWKVTFGSEPAQFTPIANNPVHGFTGWMYTQLAFTADGSSDLLSFLAVGTPNGQPPFTLLDGVSVTPVPEPSTWFLTVAGLAGLCFFRRRLGAKLAAA